MELARWLDLVSDELGLFDVDRSDAAVQALLDLARDSAHEVERVAAPLTTFLVGVAVGRGAELGPTAARISELATTSD